jgi:hypothetical protein
MNRQQTELLGRFDKDPGRFRPMFYSVRISVPMAINGVASNSVPVYNQPFILKRLTHEIIGPAADPDVLGWDVYQDGQYSISFKDEQSVYQNNPISANAMFGNVHQGLSIPLAMPLPYAGSKTLAFDVQNLVTRTLQDVEFFTLQIGLHGVSDWGDLLDRP